MTELEVAASQVSIGILTLYISGPNQAIVNRIAERQLASFQSHFKLQHFDAQNF
jgi:hypothetical protein